MAVGRSDNLPISGARPAGYVQVTAISTVKSPTIPAGARWMEIGVEAQAVRVRFDGTNPTSSVGMLYPAGASILVDARGLASANVKFLEATSGAIVNIQYWR